MSRTTQVKCRCSQCSKSPEGFMLFSRTTKHRHELMDRVNQNTTDAVDANDSDIDELTITEEPVLLDNEQDFLFEQGEALHVEEDVDDYDMDVDVDNTNNSTIRIILLFIVLFQARYLSIDAAELLLSFVACILSIFQVNGYEAIPRKLTTARELVGSETTCNGINRYVVCPVCRCIYDMRTSKGSLCSYVEFPNHTLRRPQPCKNKLFYSNTAATSSKPLLEYPYISIIKTLERFFLRPCFEEEIEQWRNREQIEGHLFDIYDGKAWNDLKGPDGGRFVDSRRSLMLSLNVDWFQPSDKMQYSTGAIYLCINNLPRSCRNKLENCILVGIMPGPSEQTSQQIGHYLKPMVDELKKLYQGIVIPTFQMSEGVLIRAALLSINCDIPASRKIGGFLSYSAKIGCSKCAQAFPTCKTDKGASKIDYSNFNEHSWVPRTCTVHKRDALAWRNAKNKTEQKGLASQTGSKWSELQRLGYLNIVRCSTIDPMHNLFLGTTKKMVSIWKDTKLLTDDQFAQMAKDAESLVIPPNYAKLPFRKIASGLTNLKSDEWRSWCLVYSPFLLTQKLAGSHFTNWMTFVSAVRLLAAPSISIIDLNTAHEKLLAFGTATASLYKPYRVTPNMHLHCHLKDCILDFGPVYAFWLYSFERFYGVMKKISINYKTGFEITYMKAFVQAVHTEDYVRSFVFSSSNDKLRPLFSSFFGSKPQEVVSVDNFDYEAFMDGPVLGASTLIKGCEPLPPSSLPLDLAKTKTVMNPEHYQCLYQYYQHVYRSVVENIVDIYSYNPYQSNLTCVKNVITKFTDVTILGQKYRSLNRKTERGIYICAHIKEVLYAGRILYFFVNEFDNKEHVFAFVEWFDQPSARFDVQSHGLMPFKKTYAKPDKLSILPVQRILTTIATCDFLGDHLRVNVLPRKMYGE